MSLQLHPPDEHQIGVEPPYDVEPEDYPFNIIRNLINEDTTVIDAVSRLAHPIENLIRSDFEAEASDGVYFLNQTLCAIVPQIPEDHPGAANLVNVVVTLMKRPDPLSSVDAEKRDKENVALGGPQFKRSSSFPWSELQAPECRYSEVPASCSIDTDRKDPGRGGYNPQFEMIPRTLPPGSKEGEKAFVDTWTRHNAFLARLVNDRHVPHREVYIARAFYAISPALEQHTEGSSADIPAAAVWLIYASKVIFEAPIIDASSLGGLGRQGGPLWADRKGKEGFSRERWRFWKEQFNSAGTAWHVTDVAKMMSKKAVEVMQATEREAEEWTAE